MSEYDFVPITDQDERERAGISKNRTQSSADVQISIQRGVIEEMDEKASLATVMTRSGNRYTIRVRTPLDLILLLWGDPKLIKNVPCMIYYRMVPSNGYIELGGPDYYKVEKKDTKVKRPFAL